MLRSLRFGRDDRRGRPAATTDERGWTRMASAASYRSNENGLGGHSLSAKYPPYIH